MRRVRNDVLPLAAIALVAMTAMTAMAAATAFASSPSNFALAMRQLDRAVTHGKIEDLQESRGAFAALVADDAGSKLAQYGLALADWRLVPMLGREQADLGRKLCKEGIDACDRALAIDAKFSDALALKAGMQGLSLTYVPNATMALGPEIEENNGRALGMAPKNPRVVLLVAIGTMHKPAFVGGGADKAKPQFERAIALYEAAAPDSSGMDWGRVDAYLWSGRCLAALEDWAGARDRYRQALAIEPEHGWLKYALLPEAEKHVAMKAGNR